ncbi:hypothetical protein CIG75_14200 [Tumebacillus algifaecis]|uniref:DUF4062 domain-containing protein n=1 Tax=Tumebacillus algifaecis TaxID=1214604 RepID=A0A223D366_9BACL|nr:DUF4062 domain-containing protein [Tumebacillus algifaecis]ASS76001.1 hypothetical protein CIG75_14200 [Tumebacillus algifaecis]
MAKPRAFISSTIHDLQHVREVVADSLRNLGIEAVLSENGHVPYGNGEALEEDCYKEIELCDILISIVGKRYGSESAEKGYSISQKELRRALLHGKQTYIFIDRYVYQDFGIYKLNKANKPITYASVADTRIFNFIEELEQFATNRPIFTFTTANDITNMLNEQLLGLFQRLLSEHNDRSRTLCKHTTQQLPPMIQARLPDQHPACVRIQTLLNIPDQITFSTVTELNGLLRQNQFHLVKPLPWESHFEWAKVLNGIQWYLRISKTIFDHDETVVYSPVKLWDDSLITLDRDELESKER